MVLHFDRLTFVDCQVLLVLFFFDSLFLMNNFKVPFFRPTFATFWQAQKNICRNFLGSLCKSETLHGSKSIKVVLRHTFFFLPK